MLLIWKLYLVYGLGLVCGHYFVITLVGIVPHKVKVKLLSMNLLYGSRWVWSLVCLSSSLVDHDTGGYDSYGEDCGILVHCFGTGLWSLGCLSLS